MMMAQGSAINQDGRSSSLTAPNGPSQTGLILTALQAADVPAGRLAGIAVHGTGTPLGDPIGERFSLLAVPFQLGPARLMPCCAAEVGAVGGALGHTGQALHQLSLVSVKSVYGHTEGAAGLTGVLMAMATLGHKAAPPIACLRNINPYVDSTLAEWGRRRLHPAVPRQLAPGSSNLSVGAYCHERAAARNVCLLMSSMGLHCRHQLLWA